MGILHLIIILKTKTKTKTIFNFPTEKETIFICLVTPNVLEN